MFAILLMRRRSSVRYRAEPLPDEGMLRRLGRRHKRGNAQTENTARIRMQSWEAQLPERMMRML